MTTITKDNGFDLNIRWRFPDGRRYAFAFIVLFVFLIIIYGNSFHCAWQFDDKPNIVENRHIFLKTLDWPDIKKTFYAPRKDSISRPLSYLSFALNYYFDELNVFGYHLVNFIIHYLSSVFLFLFIYNTLRLPAVRERYGPASYAIALMATFFWATSPVQVTAVTYIVQRMASMGGLFYITAMYFYLKGRTTNKPRKCVLFWGLCIFSAMSGFVTKENVAMLPVSIWLYDLLLIQGATRENIRKNLKLVIPVVLLVLCIGLFYTDISSLLTGYKNRPFTLIERLLTEPRIIIFYITLLLYPISSRLTLIHDIEISSSFLTPWSTLPAIAVIIILIALAVYIARKRPLISFCILFFFLNHVIESSFLPLELIYEHRNYIPSMFFFVPIVIFMLYGINYFSYKKTIQFTMVAVFTFLLAAQGHTVFVRNTVFKHPLLLWSDNVEKAPAFSRPYNNLGAAYWNLGFYDEAYEAYSRALALNRQANLSNLGVNQYNLGMHHLYITGEYDKAIQYFNEALTNYPGYAPAHQGLAIGFIQKGETQKAKKILMDALSSWPDSADLHHTLGFALLKEGKYDRAIKEALHALSIDSDLTNALSVLGETFRRKGNYRLATIYWKRYLEKNPYDLEGNLAMLELYSRGDNKDDLSRTIGKLMRMKGSKGWYEFIGQYLSDSKFSVYAPDPEKIISIIKSNLNSQLHR
ncbi:MAG: tetratricopeptide repeat protein [Thermodesulfobacteriota bacterium]|nr:tetratricopeptide repeat protein [Thermodesulfobacteriota bacterium]